MSHNYDLKTCFLVDTQSSNELDRFPFRKIFTSSTHVINRACAVHLFLDLSILKSLHGGLFGFGRIWMGVYTVFSRQDGDTALVT